MAIISSDIGDVSTYGNRMVTITITGMNQQFTHVANQHMSVSCSRLSQTMQNIHRSGGKVVAVSMGGAATAPVVSENNEPASNPGSKKKR